VTVTWRIWKRSVIIGIVWNRMYFKYVLKWALDYLWKTDSWQADFSNKACDAAIHKHFWFGYRNWAVVQNFSSFGPACSDFFCHHKSVTWFLSLRFVEPGCFTLPQTSLSASGHCSVLFLVGIVFGHLPILSHPIPSLMCHSIRSSLGLNQTSWQQSSLPLDTRLQ